MDMTQLALIAVFVAVFVGVLVIASFLYRKKELSLKKNENELFQDWQTALYDSFCHQPAETMAQKLGVNVQKYKKDCCIAEIPCNFKKLVTQMVLGIGSVVTGTLFGIILIIFSNLMLGALLFLAGLTAFLFLFSFPVNRPKSLAAKKRFQLAEDLPRFLDLLISALYIDMPITEAISITAAYLNKTLLAKEFKNALAETQIGAYNWQQALKQVAEKYEVPEFSEFVLDLIIAHEKGMPIYDLVVRENNDIKKTRSLKAKESAQKLNSTIIFPIMIFEVIPVIGIIAIPLVNQLTQI